MQEIATLILQEQSPKRLYEIRGKLYELLVNCLPPELILRRLALELFRQGILCLPVLAHRSCTCCLMEEASGSITSIGSGMLGDAVCRKLDDELRHKVIEAAALYEQRLQVGVETFHATRLACIRSRSRMRLAGGLQGDLPPGGLRGAVHERVQDVEHCDAGLMKDAMLVTAGTARKADVSQALMHGTGTGSSEILSLVPGSLPELSVTVHTASYAAPMASQCLRGSVMPPNPA